VHRAKDSALGVVGRNGGDAVQESTAQTVAASGGARGAGAAGTGVLAKLAGVGTAGKLTAMCFGSGVAATACLATGVVPARLPDLGNGSDVKPVVTAKRIGHPTRVQTSRFGAPADIPDPPEPDPEPPPTTTSVPTPPTTTTTTPTYTTTTATTPIAPTAPAPEQEYGVASAASAPTTSGSSSSGSGGGGSAVQQEFGP
jgi:hypothetical protein